MNEPLPRGRVDKETRTSWQMSDEHGQNLGVVWVKEGETFVWIDISEETGCAVSLRLTGQQARCLSDVLLDAIATAPYRSAKP